MGSKSSRREAQRRARVPPSALRLGAALLAIATFCVAEVPLLAEGSEASPAEPAVARHRALFVEGAALARANRWLEALAAFEESAGLLPHARTSFNVGYCRRALGRFTAARAAFREALALHDAGATLTEEQLAAAAEYLKEAEALVVRAEVEIAPEGTSLSLDGAGLERAADGWIAALRPGAAVNEAPGGRFTLLLDPGRHVLSATSPAGEVFTLEVNAASGESPRYRLEVPSPAERRLPDAERSSSVGQWAPRGDAATGDATTVRSVVALVLGSAALTSAGLATAFTVHAAATSSAAEEACPRRTVCPDDRARTLSSEADDFADAATVAWSVAAAAAAGAVLVFVLREDVSVSASAGYVSLTHAF
jgi:hypothetical protein